MTTAAVVVSNPPAMPPLHQGDLTAPNGAEVELFKKPEPPGVMCGIKDA